MTKNNERVAIFLLVLWSIGLCAGCSRPSFITDYGSQISINAGQFRVEMEKGSEYTDNYLVLTGSAESKIYFDGILFLMPMKKVTELASQYGNFFQCSNAGANEAKQSAKNFILIAADKQAKKEINKLGKIINSGMFFVKNRRPVIKISMIELSMLKFAMIINGQETPVENSMKFKQHFLVKGIEILSGDYKVPGYHRPIKN